MKTSILLKTDPYLFFFYERNTSNITFLNCGIDLERYELMESTKITDDNTWQYQKLTYTDMERKDLLCGVLSELFHDIKDFDWNIRWENTFRSYVLNVESPTDHALILKLKWA